MPRLPGPRRGLQGHEICLGANETALSIADVTDGEYRKVGYAHQGLLAEDQRYFFMGDKLDEVQGGVERTRTLIWDVADLDDPLLLKEHFAETGTIDHNPYVRGNPAVPGESDPGLPAFGGA